jgi:hypothetical protein
LRARLLQTPPVLRSTTGRQLGRLPIEVRLMDKDWRTKPDPFAAVWPQLEELLAVNPGLGSV